MHGYRDHFGSKSSPTEHRRNELNFSTVLAGSVLIAKNMITSGYITNDNFLVLSHLMFCTNS